MKKYLSIHQYFLMLTMTVTLLACQKENESSIGSAQVKFDQLFYNVITCQINEFKTSVYIYSPHVIGVWIDEEDAKLEYFRTVGFNSQENALYYESILKGKDSFKTALSPSSAENRRIKIVINKNKIKLIAIKKLDENKKPINPLIYTCQVRGPISSKS